MKLKGLLMQGRVQTLRARLRRKIFTAVLAAKSLRTAGIEASFGNFFGLLAMWATRCLVHNFIISHLAI
jgi:hypothetical protein